MKEQLELEHLSPYLPYGLKLFYTHTKKIGQISNIYTIGEGYDNDDIKISIAFGDGEHIWMFKPILRPLSDLTDKEIESFYNGNETNIVRMKHVITINYKLMGEWFKDVITNITYNNNPTLTMPTWIYIELLKNHFDVFNLISKGLAIDKNTLNQ